MMKKLTSLFAVCLLLVISAFAVDYTATTSVFQMRLVVDAAGPDAVPMELASRNGDHSTTNLLFVQKAVLLDQSALKSATMQTDALGHPVIDILFSQTGAREFANVTRQNVRHQLGIVIAGKLYSAPLIMAPITGGTAQISGNFTREEAKALVKKINEAITK